MRRSRNWIRFPGAGSAAAHARHGQTVMVVLAAMAAFGMVLGTLFYVNSRETNVTADTQPAPPKQPMRATPVETQPVTQTVVQPKVVSTIAPSVPTQQVAVVEVPAADENTAPVAQELSTTERIQGHLAAGEFGLAMDTAAAIADIQERAVMFREIADAQVAVGEFDSALAAINRIPDRRLQGEAHGERARQESLAGGGSTANFQQLIQLIQSETSGLWEDIDGTGGSILPYDTGVRVDPNGVLAVVSQEELNGRLEKLNLQARQADLNEDMARSSDLRVVSLTRLEREVARRVQNGEAVPATMQHLAGLTKIQYVFTDPDTGDVMIAGPAESWQVNGAGMAIGNDSHRPMLYLDDFVTVHRIFSPSGSNIFNCLIVPRQEGLKALKEYVERSNRRGALSAGAGVRNFANRCEQLLGLQDAVFGGVNADSRVARVMLEADYRMKLIGLGKLDAGKHIPSYFDLVDPKTIAQNPPALDALRWWLTMKYDAVLHSPDRTAFEIQGSSVRCQSENELVTADGQRIHTGKADAANMKFAQTFTSEYNKLAERDPVFAELQNIFDLALVAAIMRQENLTNGQSGLGVFAPKGEYETVSFPAPKTVETASQHKVYNGRDVVVQVAGGVRADLASVLRDKDIFQSNSRVGTVINRGLKNAPADRWWWDAK